MDAKTLIVLRAGSHIAAGTDRGDQARAITDQQQPAIAVGDDTAYCKVENTSTATVDETVGGLQMSNEDPFA